MMNKLGVLQINRHELGESRKSWLYEHISFYCYFTGGVLLIFKFNMSVLALVILLPLLH